LVFWKGRGPEAPQADSHGSGPPSPCELRKSPPLVAHERPATSARAGLADGGNAAEESRERERVQNSYGVVSTVLRSFKRDIEFDRQTAKPRSRIFGYFSLRQGSARGNETCPLSTWIHRASSKVCSFPEMSSACRRWFTSIADESAASPCSWPSAQREPELISAKSGAHGAHSSTESITQTG